MASAMMPRIINSIEAQDAVGASLAGASQRSVASLWEQEHQEEANQKNKNTENDNKSWKYPSRPIREAHGLSPLFMPNAHFHRPTPLLRANVRLFLRCQRIAAYFGFALSKLPERAADGMLSVTGVGSFLRRQHRAPFLESDSGVSGPTSRGSHDRL